MPPSPVVDVDGLTVTYGDVTAVRDLTFHVQQGELYALLGTNGAGKTSALEVIGGRRRETSGTVRVFGRNPLGGRAARPSAPLRTQDLTDLWSAASQGSAEVNGHELW
jgi:ABC-2 type transport system ATP-binding protein